jgi:hypothetical protein
MARSDPDADVRRSIQRYLREPWSPRDQTIVICWCEEDVK